MLAMAFLNGCGTTCHIVPEIAEVEYVDFSMVGQIEYDGNADYLPQTVKHGKGDADLPLIKYSYNVVYGKDAVPELLPLFNPLSIVGFPIGSDNIVIVGGLEIAKNGDTKQYISTCVFDKNRNLFYEGDTFSELRKKGLLMVRQNIESQMLKDREFLLSFLR